MSESEEEINILGDSEKKAKAANLIRVCSLEVMSHSFGEDPPQLIEMAGNSKSLKIIAEHVRALLQGPGMIAFDEHSRNELEYAMRSFTFQVLQQSVNSSQESQITTHFTPSNSASPVKDLNKQLVDYEKQIFQLKNRCSFLEKENESLKQEISSVQESLDKSIEENQKTINKLNLLRREKDKEISDAKQETISISNTLQTVKENFAKSEANVKKLSEQRDQLQIDLTATTNEISSIKEKLADKSKKSSQFKSAIKKLTLKLQKLENENQNLQQTNESLLHEKDHLSHEIASYDIESMNKLRQDAITNYLMSKQLTQLCEQQTAEILQLRKIVSDLQQLVNKQLQVFTEYDHRAKAALGDKEKLIQELREKQQQIEILSATNSAMTTARTTPLVTTAESFFDMPNSIASGSYEIPLSLASTLEESSHKSSNSKENVRELYFQNIRLIDIIENQIKFISSIVNNGQLKLLYLKHGDEQNSKLIDNDHNDENDVSSELFNEKILSLLDQTRKFIVDNKLKADDPKLEVESSLRKLFNHIQKSEGNHETKISSNSDENESDEYDHFDDNYFVRNLQNREFFDAISEQTLNSELLRQIADKCANETQKMKQILQQIGSIINFNGTEEELLLSLENELKTIMKFGQILNNDAKIDIASNDFDQIINKLSDVVQCFVGINTKIRDQIKYKGDNLNDLLAVLSSKLKDLETVGKGLPLPAPIQPFYSPPSLRPKSKTPLPEGMILMSPEERKRRLSSDRQSISSAFQSSSLPKENLMTIFENPQQEQMSHNSNEEEPPYSDIDTYDGMISDDSRSINSAENLGVYDGFNLFELKQTVSQEIEILKSSNSLLQGELKDTKQKKDNIQQQLEIDLNEINQLKEKVSTLQERKTELEEQLKKMLNNYKDLEQDLEEVKKERDKYHQEANKASEKAQERLEEMLREQNLQQENDIKNMQLKLQEKENKLNSDLNVKTNKIKNLKQKMKQNEKQFELQMQQQKEQMASLRAKNNELMLRLTNKPTPINEYDKLRSDLTSLQAENALLSSKLKQAQETAEQAAKLRDAYWQPILTMKEEEVTRNVTNSILEEHKEFREKLIDLLGLSLTTNNPLNEIDDDEIVFTVQKMMLQLQGQIPVQSPCHERNTSSSSQSSNSSNLPPKANEQTLQALMEWDKWGRELYVNVTDNDNIMQTSKQLRRELGELLLSSINHRNVRRELQSLRKQKQILLCMNSLEEENTTKQNEKEIVHEENISFRALSIFVLQSVRLIKISNAVSTTSFKPISPSPQKNRSLLASLSVFNQN